MNATPHVMAPARLPAWQARFAHLCQARSAQPFEWGTHDCCLWAADAVLAITGFDFAAAHRHQYHDAATAAHLLYQLGGVAGIATAALGLSVAPGQATVGDVVLVQQAGHRGLAVCNGSALLAVGEQGLMVLGMESAIAAWKV